jgi:hypothetical protein
VKFLDRSKNELNAEKQNIALSLFFTINILASYAFENNPSNRPVFLGWA